MAVGSSTEPTGRRQHSVYTGSLVGDCMYKRRINKQTKDISRHK